MNDVLDAYDFVLDLACMLPPLDSIAAVGIPAGLVMAACLGSVALLVVTVVASSLREAFPGAGGTAILLAVCIVVLSGISLGQDTLRAVFLGVYPAMVISLRGVEGLILGASYEPKARLWHLGAFPVAALGLYLALRQFPAFWLNAAKGAWAVLGALIASHGWTGKISQHRNSPFASLASQAALFLVFLSTMLYVQSSQFERVLFQWVFPVGCLAGLIASRTERRGGKWDAGNGRHGSP